MAKEAPSKVVKITEAGLRALAIATGLRQAIEPRLPAGTLDGLAADLGRLGMEVPGRHNGEAQENAMSREQALAEGYALVSAIRAAVRESGAGKDVRRAYGVGGKVRPGTPKHVKSAILQIISRATHEPSEASQLGLLQKDIAALQIDYATIASAEGTEDERHAAGPPSHKQRNQTAKRVALAVQRIGGAGLIEYARDPAARVQFEALLEAVSETKKKHGAAEAAGQPEP